ncbi:MAG: hypothetical protein IPK37_11430 [Austwickia sp.]|jgi:hypothetical protein|nr:MAG: hypothetical protein IPK37_11430 [Austwickia sp.]
MQRFPLPGALWPRLRLQRQPGLRRRAAAFVLAVATTLTATVTLAVSTVALPAGAASAAEGTPDFTIQWHEHPIHESGDGSGFERATITNTGTTDLEFSFAGFDGRRYPWPSICPIAPRESCQVTVGDLIIYGDYPRTWTSVLSATMRTPDGRTLTRSQTVTLAMVDDPPMSVDLMMAPSESDYAYDRPTFCLGSGSVRFMNFEPVRLTGLTSTTYGDLLDPANPLVRRVPPWTPYCQRGFAWQAVAEPSPDDPRTETFFLTHEDDDGGRATTEQTVTWTSASPTVPRPTIEATLTAEQESLAETGEVASFVLTIRNTGTTSATLTSMRTASGRELFVESSPTGDTHCDNSLAGLWPGGELTCRFTSRTPLRGDAGEFFTTSVTVLGTHLHQVAELSIPFRDVPPDAAVTLSAVPVDGPGSTRRQAAVTVRNLTPERGTIERLEVLALGQQIANTCTTGAAVEEGTGYRCTVTLAAPRWLANVPVAVMVRVRDDEGNVVTRSAWTLLRPWGR